MLVEREQRDGGAFGAGALTLAPPWRLGSLLRERRERAGLDLEALAAQAPRSIDAALLAAIERGDRALSDPELTLVGAVYGVEVAELAPRRVRLVVDLGEGVLGVGDRRAALGGPVGLDEVLERYLELVYSLRGIPQHRPAVLRELDIEVLADALEAGRPELERRLAQLMALSPGRPRPRRAPAVVWAAGVLVAVTAAGGLVFEQVLDTPAELAAAVTPGVSPPPAQPAPPQPPEAAAPATTAVPAAPPEEAAPAAPPPLEAALAEPAPAKPTQDEDTAVAPVVELLNPVHAAGPRYAQIGAGALARIAYPWQDLLPGWTIEFQPGNAGFLGGTLPEERRILIYVRERHSVDDVAVTVAHEIGHAVDLTFNDEHDRRLWRTARGISAATPWWPSKTTTDFDSGAGDWAESFAAWQMGAWDFRSQLGPPPTAAQLDLLASLAGG